jgi:hypothetical protein
MDTRRLHNSIRRFAVGLGVATAVYLVLIGGTGWALNHSQGLRLSQHHISRIWLPAGYEPQAAGYEVPLDVIVRDLNAGLLFSRTGAYVLDVMVGLWLITAGALLGLRLATVRGAKRQTSRPACAPIKQALAKAAPYGWSRQRSGRGKLLQFRKW